MMRRRCFTLLFVLAAVPVAAQMHVEVQPTRVLIGAEWVPRPSPGPGVLIVQAGQSVTLSGSVTYDSIENSGSLTIAPNTTLRVVTLLNLPGATLTMQAPCGATTEIIFRDVPINTSVDPFQWGNGLLNFGQETRTGCSKLTWTTTTTEIASGATSITLSEFPLGWEPGDELLIPDTRPLPQTPNGPLPASREAPVTIVAIVGNSLQLSKPLDFAHPAIRQPDGALVQMPYVANLTRNLVIRSENPNGTRGHTATIGHDASADIQYNEMRGLGRTRAANLHDTIVNSSGVVTQIGTNQRGRYSSHFHHAQGFGAIFRGNVDRGHPLSKWGLAVHGKSDGLFESNIAVDFPGAGIVTEDGNEVRNVFRKNFSAYALGNGMTSLDEFGQGNNCPGCAGHGLWARGVQNAFDDNVAINNRFAGINLFNQNQSGGQQIPTTPGGSTFVPANLPNFVPISFVGNVAIANQFNGIELWATKAFPMRDSLAAHNGARQVFAGASANINLLQINPTLIATGGASICVSSSSAYVDVNEIQGGSLRGCAEGIGLGGAISLLKIVGTTIQARVGIDMQNGTPAASQIENVAFLDLPGFPRQWILFGGPNVWAPGQPRDLIVHGELAWKEQRGSRHQIINWQGTGQDYLLFQKQQLGQNPSWTFGSGKAFTPPEAGLTMLQAWTRYGLSYGGAMLDEPDGVQLSGLINGYARAGLDPELGPPRGVVTVPNVTAPATVSNSQVRAYMLITGDSTGTDGKVDIDVDGAFLGTAASFSGAWPDERSFNLSGARIAPGSHVITTWRRTTAGQRIATSRMDFPYCVGVGCTVTEPPPPPPPDPVDCVVSAWSLGSAGSWSTIANGMQTRSETWTRTVTQQPANGGATCPILTTTGTRTATVSPSDGPGLP